MQMCWHWCGRLSCKVHLAQLPVSPVLVLWTTIHTPRMTWFLRRGHRQVVTSGEPSNCHDKRFSFLCRTCAARASLEFVPRDPPIACLPVRCITQQFRCKMLARVIRKQRWKKSLSFHVSAAVHVTGAASTGSVAVFHKLLEHIGGATCVAG